MKLVFRRYVERELDRDAGWYPRLYPMVHLDIHRAPVRRFPYGVFYALIGDDVHVLGVVHDARHPSVWRRRR